MANHAQKPSLDTYNSFASEPLSPQGGPYTNHEWSRKSPSARLPHRDSVASIASIASSIRPSFDISLHGRLAKVAADSSPNAISALLQPPIVRAGLLPHSSAPASALHKPPSTKDIPPVTLTNVPHVEPGVFQPYLEQVGILFQARQQSETEQSSAQWSRRDRPASRDEEPLGYFDTAHGEKPPMSPSQVSIVASSPVESPTLARRRSSGGVRRSQLAVAPLTSIPHVYFDESFHLENPRIFDVVTERSEVIRTPQPADSNSAGLNGSTNGASVMPRKALATNAILQEKLSWYLDTVEIHLILSISAASKSFFAALGSLKELHSQAADSVNKIQKLREDLSQLDKDMAMSRLEIVRMRQRRQNIRKLWDATLQLQNVIKAATNCEELVGQGDLQGALDRIAVLEEYTCGHISPEAASQCKWLCHEKPSQTIDLRRLKALQGFGDGMNQLRARIGAGYQSRFMEALLTDLRQHFSNVPNKDTLHRWSSASQRARGMHISTPSGAPAYLNSSNELREKLAATLLGLKRSKFTTTATTTFKEAINKEMKTIIRHNLPSSSDDDAESVTSVSTLSTRTPLTQQEKSAILARNLRNLGPDDAEELLTKTYCAVGEALRRLQVQCKLLLDVSSDSTMSPVRSPTLRSQSISSLDASLKPPTPARSPSPNLQQELMEALDLSSLLGQAVDVAQSQIIKVLKVRGEQTTRLSLQQFLRYFTLNKLFIHECEAVSGRSGYALGGVINNQTSDFIPRFATAELESIIAATNADKWDARDVTDTDSKVLERVIQGMTSDPPAYLRQANLWEDDTANGNSTNGSSNDVPKDKNARPAIIDEEKFLLSESTVLLLHGISRFETLIACIPTITSEVTSSIIEYIKRFNSQSCQLVLGAGATRSAAALKNINTKHLALASQALAFVIALIPYIREFVRRRPAMSSSPEQLVEFDKLKRLLQDHQVSIHEKLVDIMAGRAAAHIKTMATIDMDADAAREGAGLYMETLAKETTLLHRALVKHLPDATVQMIMQPVWTSYREQWGRAFRDKQIKTEEGKGRLLRDAELFNSKLEKLDGGGDVGKELITIVNEKTIIG